LEQFSRVIEVEQKLFGNLALSPQRSLDIFKMRPDIFTAVFCPSGTVAAYLTAYPLRPQIAGALIEGEIIEPDLIPDMLLTRQETLEGSCIYLGSVVVDSKFDPISKSILLVSLTQYRLHQLQDADVKRFTAIMTTASRDGEKLAQRIGAEKLNDGSNRKDGLDIYGRTITRGFIYQASSSVQRFFDNKMVRMNFDPITSEAFGEIEMATDVSWRIAAQAPSDAAISFRSLLN
jgi:hypothetical protein